MRVASEELTHAPVVLLSLLYIFILSAAPEKPTAHFLCHVPSLENRGAFAGMLHHSPLCPSALSVSMDKPRALFFPWFICLFQLCVPVSSDINYKDNSKIDAPTTF